MTTDRQKILKAAQNMIDRYSDDVLQEVDLRIEELKQQGQSDAHELWKEIRKAVLFITEASNSQTRH